MAAVITIGWGIDHWSKLIRTPDSDVTKSVLCEGAKPNAATLSPEMHYVFRSEKVKVLLEWYRLSWWSPLSGEYASDS